MGVGVELPAENVTVEGRRLLGVRRPHRDIADISVLDRHRRAGRRAVERPAVPEGVDDRGIARTVSLTGFLTHGGAAVTGPLYRTVGILDRDYQHD